MIYLINGPLTKEVALPPEGETAVEEVFNNVSLLDELVPIIPFVSINTLLTSTEPFVPIFNPAGLLISRLFSLLAPEKSPVGPPTD